jgi:hypothetical protein
MHALLAELLSKAPKSQGEFKSSISNPMAARAVEQNGTHPDRRAKEAPADSKKERHGRTNKPQNRSEKLPNVPSEIYRNMRNRSKKQQPKGQRERHRWIEKNKLNFEQRPQINSRRRPRTEIYSSAGVQCR